MTKNYSFYKQADILVINKYIFHNNVKKLYFLLYRSKTNVKKNVCSKS